MSTPPLVTAIVPCIAPYHHARFRALARLAPLRVIELATDEREYAWRRATEDGGYERQVLFPGADARGLARSPLRSRLLDALASMRPSALAVPGWHEPAARMALAWGARAGVPMVMLSDSRAEDQPRSWWKERLKRRLVSRCGAALVAGRPHVGYLAGLGMPRERIFTGYDVVDNAHFSRPRPVGDDAAHARRRLGLPARYLLACGRMIPRKGHRALLRAYAEYRARGAPRGWSLVLIGDGPERAALAAAAASLGIAGDVVMPGAISYDDIPDYYALADAFVHPSAIDQWGLVVNEAMAAGLPVIVSDGAGCAEDLVQEDTTGWVYPAEDAAALAGVLLRAASRDLQPMADAARRHIAGWSVDSFARGLLAAVEAARAAGRKPRSFLDRLVLRAAESV